MTGQKEINSQNFFSMNSSRRDFLKQASALTVLGVFPQSPFLWPARQKPLLRVIIASDFHYGQPKTDFEAMASTFVNKANAFTKAHSCDFCILNGDLIHDQPEWAEKAKASYDRLSLPYYVTKGNHDRLSDAAWEEIWKMPVNFSFEKKKTGFIFGTTSNEKGEYLSPDLDFLKKELDKYARLKTVILVLHIPQAKWTANGIENKEFFELVSNYPNLKAIFHGHEHDQDGIVMHEGKPYVFDSHIGGSWGTPYRGFRVLEISKAGELVTYLMDPDVELSRDNLTANITNP